ncbi:MAG: rhodanese-like domain-containing protein [Chlorobium sp.]|jgi:rhodanese-related sulfurtransferase|nr:rhodanese-like domain-containing protein [Chlorobium sp.]
MIQKGALLVDVREPHEVARKSFDVPDSMLIPLSQLHKRFKEIPAKRQTVIACRSGNRSVTAIRFLMSHGYSKAVNLQDGIIRWEKEGLPVRRPLKQKSGSWFTRLFGRKSPVQ